LRQRHGQPERPRSREPADHRRRRRRGPDEGRTAHQLRGTDAAGEPAPDAAREGRRAARQVRRQPGKDRRAARSLTHGADIMIGSTSFGLSAAALLLPGGETALMTAARVGTLASVKALVARGATVDSKDEKHGQTALMWAAAEGHAPVVEMLIEVGADFKARLASGMTPLLFASREGHSDVVRALLKAGVDVNEPVPVEGGRRRAVGGRALPPGATPLLTAVMNA